MTTNSLELTRIQNTRPLSQELKAPQTKIERIWDFVNECIIKEFGSCLRHGWYRVVYWINPHKHGLNPTQIQKASHLNQTAKVVLLMHAAGAHPSSFIPMAKKLSEANIKNIFTVTLQQSEDDPIPVSQLKTRIKDITRLYQDKGYKNVEFALVGHSLGALVGAKYIWRSKDTQILMMISIAGRLRFTPNRFFWFCEDVKPEIDETYKAYKKDPNKVPLYSIWGDGDAIVPKQSAHIQGESSRECTVNGWGHGGIVYAHQTQTQVASWLNKTLVL